jgi:hypothetical protein
VSAGRSTTTRRTLLRLQAALLVTGAVALGGCLAVSVGVARTAEAAADRSIPATLAAYDAQVAMRTAHREAVDNLTATKDLRDPGSEYQHQITLAGQYLAVVAERNAAGAAGSGDIQVVQALLSTYVGLIAAAATNFTSGPTFGLATLLDATRLLDNILVRLDGLRDRQDDALQAQATSGWGHPATTALWLFPVVALVTLLVLTQVVLRRRFRRRFCPPLLVATVLAASLGVATGWSTRTAGDLDDGWNQAAGLVAGRAAQLAAWGVEDSRRLRTLIGEGCVTGCERTIGSLDTASPNGAVDAGAVDAASTELGATADEAAADAATSGTINILLPVTALTVVALLLAGFRPRLDEYRYRPT